MLTKKMVLSTLKGLPETFDTTLLFDRLVLLNKIEEGRQQAKEGKTYTTDQAKRKLKKWLK